MMFRSLGPRRLMIAATIALAVSDASGLANEKTEVASSQVDCGPAALHTLLSVEGRSVGFTKVAARLPHRRGGHSMKELRDVAWSFGLNLEGRHIGKDIRAIDRPMLAFIKDDRLRHFLVIRPVGHTGSLVQVIDSNEPPQIMDKADLVASNQWTGVVLAPKRTSWAAVGGLSLLAVPGLVGLGRLIKRRDRGRRPVNSA